MVGRRLKRRVKSSGRKVAGRARRTTGVAPLRARRCARTATSGVLQPARVARSDGTDARGRRTKRAARTAAAGSRHLQEQRPLANAKDFVTQNPVDTDGPGVDVVETP